MDKSAEQEELAHELWLQTVSPGDSAGTSKLNELLHWLVVPASIPKVLAAYSHWLMQSQHCE